MRIEAVTLMISKNRAKFIKSLQLKKFRKEEGAFVVEGGKSVLEAINSRFELIELFATESFFQQHRQTFLSARIPCQLVSEKELLMAGSLKSNNSALAVVSLPPAAVKDPSPDDFVLALDDVRDPGNLGTIIRIADWYGISKIYCSEETTDAFAPKVVQAGMGSLTRVDIFYCSLAPLLRKGSLPVYGALLEGKSVYEEHFSIPGFILMGNESTGISDELKKLITHPVTIPRVGGAESLNVAIATAVICDNLRRRTP